MHALINISSFFENSFAKLKTNIDKIVLGCICAGFLSVFIFPSNPDLFRHQMFWGFVFLWSTISLSAAIVFDSKIAGITLAYFGWNSLRILAANTSADWAIGISSQSFITLALLTFFVIAVGRTPSMRKEIPGLLAAICFGVSCLLIVKKSLGLLPYAYMNNAAADASMIAVLYPILICGPHRGQQAPTWLSILFFIVPPIACGVSGSSTGVAAIGLASVIYYFSFIRKHEFRLIALIGLGATFVILLASIPLFFTDHVMADNGRYGIWRFMLTCWWHGYDRVFGAGGGTFFLLGPALMLKAKFDANALFAWMHNDYFQILFEQGIAGLVLFLLTAYVILKRAFNRLWLFSSLVTFGFTMLLQYPLRFLASALIAAVLAGEALSDQKENR